MPCPSCNFGAYLGITKEIFVCAKCASALKLNVDKFELLTEQDETALDDNVREELNDAQWAIKTTYKPQRR
jgi:hypothetical protein